MGIIDVLESVTACLANTDARSRGHKTFVMLNSAEQTIYLRFSIKISRNSACSSSEKPRLLFIMLINLLF